MGRLDVVLAVVVVAALACGDVPASRDGAPVGDDCGDGVVQSGEACDDGNDADTDACLSDCNLARCGDGFVRLEVEECDDAANPDCVACLDCDPGNAAESSLSWSENGHCYTAVEASITQDEARLACAEAGGQLFDMNSEAERDAVIPALFDVDQSPIVGYWFGLTQVPNYPGDLAELEAWRWESGETPSFEYWNCCGRGGGLEPTATESEACAELIIGYDGSVERGLDGLWNDLGCSPNRRFLCERQAMALSPTDNHAYRVHYAPMSWQAAATFCEQQGATLASPTTDADNVFVASLLGREVWIGAYENPFGGYAWRSGEGFEFEAWAEQEPVTAAGCATTDASGAWRTASCDDPRPFVCEHS